MNATQPTPLSTARRSLSLAPPSSVDEAAPPSAQRLRKSLAACSAEGLAAEVVGACFGPAVVTAWGIELGASPLLLGVLWAVPHFGQVFQLPAAWVTTFFGRKRVAVTVQALARQVTLPIAALPFVDISIEAKRALLISLFALSSLLSVVGHNAWLAWMGDLVPERIRGTYFGRRAAMGSAVGIAATVAVASSLDTGRTHTLLGPVLAGVLVLRSIAGAMTTALMARQHDPPRVELPPRLADIALPLADRGYRTLLAYGAAWGIATGLTASIAAVLTLRTPRPRLLGHRVLRSDRSGAPHRDDTAVGTNARSSRGSSRARSVQLRCCAELPLVGRRELRASVAHRARRTGVRALDRRTRARALHSAALDGPERSPAPFRRREPDRHRRRVWAVVGRRRSARRDRSRSRRCSCSRRPGV